MGTYTQFSGSFSITPALTPGQVESIMGFINLSDDVNKLPKGVPNWYCYWEVSADGSKLSAIEDEIKAYDDFEWLPYLVKHFFQPWGCRLSGEIEWETEGGNGSGVIYAKDFAIECVENVNPGPSWSPKWKEIK